MDITIQIESRKLLHRWESEWLLRYDFLSESGYELRPRYRPGWIASWLKDKTKKSVRCEDGVSLPRGVPMDLVRVKDGRRVMIKRVHATSPEIVIGKYLMQDINRADPNNNTIPILEVFPDPHQDEALFMVLPVLRPISDPPLATVAEAFDFMEQMLKGMIFLHVHSIAHRDCALPNIMMDARPLFTKEWHPQSIHRDVEMNPISSITRTEAGGVKYYFIDLGLSTQNQDMVSDTWGHVDAPEFSKLVPYDPYKLDIYILGFSFKKFLFEYHRRLGVVRPLLEWMTEIDPSERPTAIEAYEKLLKIKNSRSQREMNRRVRSTERDFRNQVVETKVEARKRDVAFFFQNWNKPPLQKLPKLAELPPLDY